MDRGRITGRRLGACMGVVLLVAAAVAVAQDRPNAKQAGAQRRSRGRLPNYYAQVVSGDQRNKIYEIQLEYQPIIEELEKQLAELVKERNGKVRDVLTPEQQKRVDELAAEAKAKRQRRSQQNSADENEQTSSSEESNETASK